MNRIVGITLFTMLPFLTMAQVSGSREGQGFFQDMFGDQMTWPVLAALFLSTAAVLLQLFWKPKVSKSTGRTADTIAINTLREELSMLKGDGSYSVTRRDLERLEARIKKIEETIQPQPAVREVEWTNLKTSRVSPEAEELQAAGPSEPDSKEQPSQQLFYAKFPDLEEGFSTNVLSSIQNGENIYEIESVDDSAVYRISSDPHAQKYALAESSFTLGKACELENQPFKGCQILLKRKGLLLNISGNWIIQQKAIIAFK
jgi:hypothetical protein